MSRRKHMMEDLDQDIRDYLERETQDNIERGMSPEEAHYAALRKFGNVTRVKEETWEVWGFVWLEQLWQDIRLALRLLRKNPGFTAVALLTLALGIGANTAIFSVVYAVLLRPLPFKDPGRLVMVWATWAKRGENHIYVSGPDFADWKEQCKTLEHMTAMWRNGSLITINGEPTRIPAVRVTSDFFDLLGVRPARGRAFSPEEQTHEGFRVVILSDSLWRRLGGDPTVMGKTVQLNREPWTVVGVMPPGFDFPADDEAWFPLPQDAVVGQRRGNGNFRVIGKLKPGVSIAQTQSEMDTIAARLRQAYPKENGEMGTGVNVVSLQEQTVGEVRRALLVLLAAVGCLLLIACANVANLMLARATARQREFALRLTLGASRWRMIRYALTESTLLAVAGGALGVAWAYWGVRAFVAFDPVKLPRIQEIAVNPSMLFFTLLVAISTGVLCGLSPALRSSRPDLNETLKEGAERLGGGPSRTRAPSVLAIVQVALSMVLLTSAGLLLRSFVRRVNVPLGFRPEGLLAVELPWNVNAKIDELLERLRALPGVQSAGAATNRDLAKSVQTGRFRSDLFYRLNVFPIEVPPLRDRASDIPQLAMFFLSRYSRKLGKSIEGLSQDSMDRLMRYAWPGNVRELQNIVERAVILSQGPILDVEPELVPVLASGVPPDLARKAFEMAAAQSSGPLPAAPPTLEAVERAHIMAVLKETDGVIEGPKGAAKILNLHPNTLRHRLKKLGIKRSAYRLASGT
jgi:hypothetical protein